MSLDPKSVFCYIFSMAQPGYPKLIMLLAVAACSALLAPARTRAISLTACRSDIGTHCISVDKAQLTNCLTDNWGRISRDCRESIYDSPDNPCRQSISSYCLDSERGSSLDACLKRNFKKLPAACRTKMLSERAKKTEAWKKACAAPLKTSCAKAAAAPDASEDAALSCLIEHMDDISAACYASIQAMGMPPVCAKDADRFCAEANTRRDEWACLNEHLHQLSPLCRKIRLWSPCSRFAVAFCPSWPIKRGGACLLRQTDMLDEPCLKTLGTSQTPDEWQASCSAAHQRFCKEFPRSQLQAVNSCLLEHLMQLPPDCLITMRGSPSWPRPCAKDTQRLCSEVRTQPSATQGCLMDHLDQLSQTCRDVLLWSPCAGPAIRLCENKPFAQSRSCLLKNGDKLPPACLNALAERKP